MVEGSGGEDAAGSNFWTIKWDNTRLSTGDKDSFFSEQDFEKHSVTHKNFLISLYGCSSNEIVKEIAKQSSKAGEPSKQKFQEVKVKFSSLTSVEQQLYLQLLQKYSERICNNPSTEEKNEIQKLGELHVKVVHEQGELIQHLKESSRKLNYNHIHPEALRYVQQLLKKKLNQSLAAYPRHYSLDQEIQFPSSDEVQDDDSTFSSRKTIVELGRVPRLVLPTLQKPCVLPMDYEKINKRFPMTVGGVNLHPSKNPVSQDSVAKTLAEKYQADFVLSSSSLKTLLDNNTPEYDREWELPAVVEEITDSTGSRKVVYLDKALPRSRLNGKERNNIYHKYAVKVQFSHFNPARKVVRTGDINEKVATPRRVENRTLSAVDTDLFGDSNNMMELETFGMSTNGTAFQWNECRPNKSEIQVSQCSAVGDEKPKNIELESPASPDPEDNPDLTSTPMKVVNINSSLDSSSEADSLNVFQKPLIPVPVPLKKPKLDINSTCKSNDSDSDALVIDFDDTLTNASKSSLSEDIEKLDMESESSPRRSPRNRNVQSKVVPEILSITTPKKANKSKETEIRTRMVLRSKKKEAEPLQDTTSGIQEMLNVPEKVLEVEKSENEGKTDEFVDSGHDHEKEKLKMNVSQLEKSDASCKKEKEDDFLAGDALSKHTSLNAGNSKASPLESILQLQKELLKTHISDVDVAPKLTDIQIEKTSQYPTPDPMDNVVYSLCTLGKWNLLIRQQVNTLQSPNGNPCFLYPKLEYQSEYGGELNSKSDLIRQWSSLIVQRNSQVLRVRINAYTSSILMCENVSLKTIIEKNKTRFQPEIQVKQLASILKSFQRLPSGQYISMHKNSEPKISVYKMTDNNKRGTLDLHILLQQRQMEVSDGLKPCFDSSCWLPIDTEILLPSLLKQHRVPATYPPQASFQFRGERKKKRKQPPKHTKKNLNS